MKLSRNLPKEKAAEISQQQFFDWLKHITTLSSASVVLLATFLEKLIKNPEWRWLIGATFILFITSIIASVLLMFWQALFAEDDLGELTREGFLSYLVLVIIAFWSFVGGMVCLVIFSLKNIY